MPDALQRSLADTRVGFVETDAPVVIAPADAFGFVIGFIQRSKRRSSSAIRAKTPSQSPRLA